MDSFHVEPQEAVAFITCKFFQSKLWSAQAIILLCRVAGRFFFVKSLLAVFPKVTCSRLRQVVTSFFLFYIFQKKLRVLLRPSIILDLHLKWTNHLTPKCFVYWSVNVKKKTFHDTLAIDLYIDTSEQPPHQSIKTFLWYLKFIFLEIQGFSSVVF